MRVLLISSIIVVGLVHAENGGLPNCSFPRSPNSSALVKECQTRFQRTIPNECRSFPGEIFCCPQTYVTALEQDRSDPNKVQCCTDGQDLKCVQANHFRRR